MKMDNKGQTIKAIPITWIATTWFQEMFCLDASSKNLDMWILLNAHIIIRDIMANHKVYVHDLPYTYCWRPGEII